MNYNLCVILFMGKCRIQENQNKHKISQGTKQTSRVRAVFEQWMKRPSSKPPRRNRKSYRSITG